MNILERMSFKELNSLEKKFDILFGNSNIDIDFTDHFKKRVIERNIKPDDLINSLYKLYNMYKSIITRDDFHGLVFDISSYLTIPIYVEWKEKNGEYELYLLTAYKARDGKPRPRENSILIKV